MWSISKILWVAAGATGALVFTVLTGVGTYLCYKSKKKAMAVESATADRLKDEKRSKEEADMRKAEQAGKQARARRLARSFGEFGESSRAKVDVEDGPPMLPAESAI